MEYLSCCRGIWTVPVACPCAIIAMLYSAGEDIHGEWEIGYIGSSDTFIWCQSKTGQRKDPDKEKCQNSIKTFEEMSG